MRSTVAKFAIVAATAVATTLAFAGSATADPGAGYSPTINDIAAVGSDTTELVVNNLAWGSDAPSGTTPTGGYDATVSQSTGWVDSWNATGSAPIVTKPGCSVNPRPNGSGSGITALKTTVNSTVDTTKPCVDFARSSRGPQTGDADTLGHALLFLPFATDGLKYATSAPTTSFPTVPVTHAPQDLTAAELQTIYTTVGIRWSDVRPGASTDVIEKVIPQAGSGTRTFFEQQIGIADNQLASDVITGQEHDPAPVRVDADRIAPFSVARFKHVDSDQGIQLDASGFSATRKIYNVTKVSPTTLQVPAYLQPFFGNGGGSNSAGTLGGYVCSAAGRAIVSAEGFTPLPLGTTANHCGFAEHI